MTKTLTQLITIVQDNLLDTGTRFTTSTCTAALRNALKEINQRAPINAAELIDAVDDQQEWELSDIDDRAITVNDILLYDQDHAEQHIPLPYDEYWEDARLFFRLRTAQPSSEIILARFAIPHTISGLDSQSESTLPAYFDDILIDGGCFYACQIRSAGRVETINLQQKVTENWLDLKRFYRTSFDRGLALMASRKSPVAEPDNYRWEI
jgi:hypothetical protein